MNNNYIKIKETAYNIFLQKGYREAKILDIASESGIAVGTIYKYFKSKYELFNSINLPKQNYEQLTYTKKRKEIIEKALEIFGEYGYANTSMESIATACDFSKAALYQYFNSKEELFIEIFHQSSLMSGIVHLPSFDHTEQPIKFVLLHVGNLFLKTLTEPLRLNLMRTAIAESKRFPEIGELIYNNAVDDISTEFAKYLEVMDTKGEISCNDFKFASRSFFGILLSFIILDKLIKRSDDKFEINGLSEKAAEIFLNGIKKR